MVNIFSPLFAFWMLIFSMECVLDSSRSTNFLYFYNYTLSFYNFTLRLTSLRCSFFSLAEQSYFNFRLSYTKKSLKLRTFRMISSHFSLFQDVKAPPSSSAPSTSLLTLYLGANKRYFSCGLGDLVREVCALRDYLIFDLLSFAIGEYLMGDSYRQYGLFGAIISRKGEREDGRFLCPKMVLVFRGRSLISTFPILLLILCPQQFDSLMDKPHEGFEYIQGDEQHPAMAVTQACCGQFVGCFKAWLPCVGCFCCCCSNPYVTIPQGSKGLLLNFSKYVRTCEPGLHYVNPVTEEMVLVDCRISVASLPSQRLMTRDNISITVDSCIYYYINQPHLNYFRVDNLEAALMKISGGIIKNTIAIFTFQELLEKKAEITADIEKQVRPVIANWGIAIDNICLKNFGISKDLENELVSAPVARRNAQSKLINAKGQVEIAKLLGERSAVLNTATAIQVRYLQTLKGLARNGSSSMIYRSF